MFVRTKPVNNGQLGITMVVTKEETEKIEEEWTIVMGTHEQYLAKKKKWEQHKRQLRRRFGREPSGHDIKWSLLNSQLIEEAKNHNWGLYRNTRLEMVELLQKESKFKQALQTYLEICYLDLNGPNNRGNIDNPDLLSQFPPFDPQQNAFLAPGIISRIKRIMEQLSLQTKDVQQMFMDHKSMVYRSLKLPVAPRKAWKMLSKEINST